MGTWQAPKFESPPQTQDVQELRKYIKYLVNIIALMAKDLDFTLNGDITFKNVRAKSLTADRLDVDELSAISADIGEVTAGTIRGINIFGSFIATKESGYPRIEFSSAGDLLRALSDENNFVSLEASYSGSPAFVQVSSWNTTVMNTTPTHTAYNTTNDMYITSNTGNIILNPEMGSVNVDSFNKIFSYFEGVSLGTALSDLSDRISSVESSLSGKANSGHTHTVTTTSGGGTFTTSS